MEKVQRSISEGQRLTLGERVFASGVSTYAGNGIFPKDYGLSYYFLFSSFAFSWANPISFKPCLTGQGASEKLALFDKIHAIEGSKQDGRI